MTTITWNASSGGKWETAANWSPEVVPSGDDDVAISVTGTITISSSVEVNQISDSGATVALTGGSIDGATLSSFGGGQFVTASGQSGSLDNMTIAVGTTFTGEDGSSTSLYDTITNDGTLALASTGDATSFVGFDATIAGTGTILLGDNANNVISTGQNVSLTIGSGQTVEGSGQIYGYGPAANNSPAIINGGLFLADQSPPLTVGSYVENLGILEATTGGTLDVGGSTAPSAGVINDDTIEANGGVVDVVGIVAQGADGAIEALNGGTVALGAPGDRGWISGGTLIAQNGGVLETAAGESALLDGVTIAAGTTYTAEDGSSTSLYDTIANDGTLALASTGDATSFVGFDATIAGTGTVLLGDNANNVISTGQNVSLTIGSGQTVEGSGQIYGYGPAANNSPAIINEGLFLADQSPPLTVGSYVENLGTLEATTGGTLDVGGSTAPSAGVINDDTIEANGGVVDVVGIVAQGADGAIEALNGGTVALGAPGDRGWISGGTLIAQNGGVLETAAGESALLDGVTIAAGTTYTAEDGSSTSLYDTITNDGTLALASTGDATSFVGFDATIAGTGTILLGDNANNVISTGQNVSLTIGSGQTVEGSGQIYGYGPAANNSPAIINEGLFLADQSPPLTVGSYVENLGTLEATTGGTLDVGGSTAPSAGVINDDTIEANGGVVDVVGIVAQGADGAIEALNGGTVALGAPGDRGWISGGTLIAQNGGVLETAAGESALLDGVTIAAGTTYTAEDGSSTSLYDTITNDGTLALASTGDATSFVGFDATIAGTGTVLLGDNANNVISTGQNVSLTIGSGQTVEGSGQIYGYGPAANNSPAIINEGLFLADQSPPLTVGSYVENLGTLEATTGGTLDVGGSTAPSAGVINDDTIEANGGVVDVVGIVAQGADGAIEALNGGTVALGAPGDRGWISGGTLIAQNGGVLETAAGESALLDGVTIAAGTTYTAEDGSSTSLYDTITNDGTLALASTGDATSFVGFDATIAGTGTILLGDNANNVISTGQNVSLTIGSGQTVEGSGQIYGYGPAANNSPAIINEGLFLADQSPPLTVGSYVENLGTLEATTGGTLDVGGATAQYAGVINNGVIEADGGTVDLIGVVSQGGNGVIEALNGGTLVFQASNNIGGMLAFVGSGNTLQIDGTDALSATPTADSSNTTLTVNLSGGGSLTYTLAGDYVGETFAVTHQGANSVIAIPVQSGPLSISAPANATVGISEPDAISGISIAESPTASGETFTVTLSDINGDLAATGVGVTGSGTPNLTVSGSYVQVNSDLATLTDTDATPGSDTITIDASDSNGGVATPSTIAIGVNGPPILTAPTEATIGVGQTNAVDGVSLTESGNTSAETFTLTLVDTNGDLSADGSGVSGSGTTSLTISGSLAQVNAALATLTDADSVTGSDAITINASDSLGNIAGPSEIAVDVNGSTGSYCPYNRYRGPGRSDANSDCRPVRDRKRNGRNLRGHAIRQFWAPLGDRLGRFWGGNDRADDHRLLQPSEARSCHADGHRSRFDARYDHGQRDR